jgi:hypothetical protein
VNSNICDIVKSQGCESALLRCFLPPESHSEECKLGKDPRLTKLLIFF